MPDVVWGDSGSGDNAVLVRCMTNIVVPPPRTMTAIEINIQLRMLSSIVGNVNWLEVASAWRLVKTGAAQQTGKKQHGENLPEFSNHQQRPEADIKSDFEGEQN